MLYVSLTFFMRSIVDSSRCLRESKIYKACAAPVECSRTWSAELLGRPCMPARPRGYRAALRPEKPSSHRNAALAEIAPAEHGVEQVRHSVRSAVLCLPHARHKVLEALRAPALGAEAPRSEERRVGKECRSRLSP